MTWIRRDARWAARESFPGPGLHDAPCYKPDGARCGAAPDGCISPWANAEKRCVAMSTWAEIVALRASERAWCTCFAALYYA